MAQLGVAALDMGGAVACTQMALPAGIVFDAVPGAFTLSQPDRTLDIPGISNGSPPKHKAAHKYELSK
jgi:hypothetical protein